MNNKPFYLIVAPESIESMLNNALYRKNHDYLSRIMHNINTIIKYVPQEDRATVSEKTPTPFALNKHAEGMIGDKYRRINLVGGWWSMDDDSDFKVNDEIHFLKEAGYRNVNVQESATLIREKLHESVQ